MKFHWIAIGLAVALSNLSFAQSDGYHVEPETVCGTSDSCLINAYDGRVIRFADRGLTSYSTLSDTIHLRSKHCYQGNPDEVCGILSEMARFEGRQYYNGGHSLVTRFACDTRSLGGGVIGLTFDVRYDMGLPKKETIEKQIPICIR